MTMPEHDDQETGVVIDPAVLFSERECLGAAMRSPEALEVVLGTLEDTDYALSKHQAIHQVLLDRAVAGKPCDELSVLGDLARRPAVSSLGERGPRLVESVGAAYLHDLVWRSGAGSVDHHVGVVETAARRREVAAQAEELARLARTGRVDMQELRARLLGALETTRRAAAMRWTEPKPLTRALPELPVDALPGVVGRLARAVAATTETAPDLAAFAGLATLAAATRGAWEIRVDNDWVEQTCLYVAALADSGERKSAVVGIATAPLRKVERDAAGDDLGRSQREILTKRFAAAIDTAARAPEGERDEAEREAAELEAQLEALEFQILGDDVTPEALAARMHRQGGPLAIISDEGGLLGTVAGRYSANVPNVDLILKAYNGAYARVDRASKPSITISRPILTIGLIVQPDVIAEAAKVRAFVQRGLLARFLFALPATRVGTRPGGAPPMAPEVKAEWAAVIEKIFAAGREITARREVGVIRCDPDARQLFERWRTLGGHESRLHAELGDLTDLRQWASKLPGALVRVAGLFALAERPGETQSRITLAEMRAALDLAPYLVEHAREVLASTAGDRRERVEAVLAVIRAFLRGGSFANNTEVGGANRIKADTSHEADPEDDVFSVRDVFRALNGRAWVHRADDVADVLSELADLGYVRALPPELPKRGRPPSPRYQAHPRLVTAARRSRR